MIARAGRIGVVLIVSIAIFCCWVAIASDYGDSVAAGTYRFSQGGVISELVLKPDHTFVQKVNSVGSVAYAVGTWRRVGEGGISFSNTLLPIPGEEVEPDGTSFADMDKVLGLFVTLQMRRYHVLWYGRSDFQLIQSPVGKYYSDNQGVTATLTLGADQSFEQEVTHSAFRPVQRDHGPTERMEPSYSPPPSSRFQVSHSAGRNQPPLLIPEAAITFRSKSRTSPRLEHRPSERNGSFGKRQKLTGPFLL